MCSRCRSAATGHSAGARSDRSTWWPAARRFAGACPPCPSLATGVGKSEQCSGLWSVPKDEHPFTSMGRANVGSSYARPHRVIPELGQVPEYAVKPSPPDGGHVLHDDELRL